METDVRLIRDKSELEGTAYFEFLPGCCADKHWNDNSVLLEEEVMCMIERSFMDTLSDYDHCAFSTVARDRRQLVLERLCGRKPTLEDAGSVGDVEDRFCCIRPGRTESFGEDFEGNRKRLTALIDEFTDWVNQTLHEHESIAI